MELTGINLKPAQYSNSYCMFNGPNNYDALKAYKLSEKKQCKYSEGTKGSRIIICNRKSLKDGYL